MFDLFRERAETHVQLLQTQKFLKEFELFDREEAISTKQVYRVNECGVYLWQFASPYFPDELYGRWIGFRDTSSIGLPAAECFSP